MAALELVGLIRLFVVRLVFFAIHSFDTVFVRNFVGAFAPLFTFFFFFLDILFLRSLYGLSLINLPFFVAWEPAATNDRCYSSLNLVSLLHVLHQVSLCTILLKFAM